MLLKNRIAVVHGGGGAIGGAAARAFARDGARVVITHPPCDVVHSLTPWGYGTH